MSKSYAVGRNLVRLQRRLRQPVVLFLVSAALRLGVSAVLLAHNPRVWGVNEAAGIGRELVLGRGFASPFHDATGPTAWLAPVYPSLLAGLFWLFGIQTTASAWAAVFLNVIFASLTSVVILKLGKEYFGETAGLIAGWAWAVSLPVVVMPWLVWETSLSALVMSFALLQTLKLGAQAGSRQAIFCGCVWSLAALLNPALLAPFPALAVWSVWKRRSWKLPAAMVLAFVIGLVPWTVRNLLTFHQLVPVRSNFWPEAFFGNVTFSLHPIGDSMVYQKEGEIAFADDLRARVIEHVRSSPGEFARQVRQRVFAFWTAPWHFGPYAAILFVAAFAGILLARHAGREWIPFALVLGLYPLTYYVTYTFARYRHPIEPLMYVLAGFALAEAVAYGRRRVVARGAGYGAS